MAAEKVSFKQLQADGVLKRQDSHAVRFDDIVIAAGFNKRRPGERLQAHIRAIADFMKGGGSVPPIEVRPVPGVEGDNGKVEVVDGHCRYDAYALLRAEGQPVEWIQIRQFVGNDVKRMARIATSQEGLKLDPLEMADLYASMRGMGLSPEEIGNEVGKTRQHVDQILHLADAPHAIKKAVEAGEVSATEALKMARKHGDGATDVLKEAQEKTGGKKVTGKALKQFSPPSGLANELVAALDTFAACVNTDDMVNAQREGGADDIVTLRVKRGAVHILVDSYGAIELARDKAKEKARKAAEKAAQTDLAQAA